MNPGENQPESSEPPRLTGGEGFATAHLATHLLPQIYEELRRLAARKLGQERSGQTLDATALVHEVYLRLAGQQRFVNRQHFFAAAAEAMRRILIETARRKGRIKHGGGLHRQDLDPESLADPGVDKELLELDQALDRLASKHPEKARLVELRYFAGLTGDQAAEILGISPSTADRDWVFARAWLRRDMEGTHSIPRQPPQP